MADTQPGFTARITAMRKAAQDLTAIGELLASEADHMEDASKRFLERQMRKAVR